MKKLIFSAVATLMLSVSAEAFIPQMSFYVNREVAVARVYNSTFYPIACNGQAFGATYNGVVLNTWVNSLVIMPNTFVEVYVHSNYYDPMARSWAHIECNY